MGTARRESFSLGLRYHLIASFSFGGGGSWWPAKSIDSKRFFSISYRTSTLTEAAKERLSPGLELVQGLSLDRSCGIPTSPHRYGSDQQTRADAAPQLCPVDAAPQRNRVDAAPQLSPVDAAPQLTRVDAAPQLSPVDTAPIQEFSWAGL